MGSQFPWRKAPDTNLSASPGAQPAQSDPLLYDLVRRDFNPGKSQDEGNPPPAPGWIQKGLALLKKQRLPQIDWAPRKQTVTLSIERDVIRVVVFKGKTVVAWGLAALEEGTSPAEHTGTPPSDEESAEMSHASHLAGLLSGLGIQSGGRLWNLLNQIGIRQGKVVMDLSLYTTLMRRLRIPKVRRKYLQPVVASEVLESIPFEEDEVDLAWALEWTDEGPSVFAIALPKQRVDSQVSLVKEAGLIPAAAYSKAAALALASGVSDAILVHLEPSEAAIVLACQGDPQVVHQLELGKGNSTPQELARALARAANQVAGYYQPFDPAEQGESLPVILTGQSSDTALLVNTLQDILRRQVLPPQPPLDYPQDFPLEEYAANMGLFLADRFSRKGQKQDSGQTAHSLNLLPERHRPRQLPVLQAAVFITLLLLAVHPFNVSNLVDAKVMEKQAISRDLQELKAQERNHDLRLASRQESKKVLENTTGQIQKIESRLETLQEDMDTHLARLVTMTSLALPPNVELAGVAPLGDGYSLSGSASSYTEALQYVNNLKTYPVFEDARALRVEGSGGTNPEGGVGRISFQIRVSLPEEPTSEEGDSAK